MRIYETPRLKIAIVGRLSGRGKSETLLVPMGEVYPVGEVVEPEGNNGMGFFTHPDRPGATSANEGEFITGFWYFPEVLIEKPVGEALTPGQILSWDRIDREFVVGANPSGRRRPCLRVRGPMPGAPRGPIPADNVDPTTGREVCVAEFVGNLVELIDQT